MSSSTVTYEKPKATVQWVHSPEIVCATYICFFCLEGTGKSLKRAKEVRHQTKFVFSPLQKVIQDGGRQIDSGTALDQLCGSGLCITREMLKKQQWSAKYVEEGMGHLLRAKYTIRVYRVETNAYLPFQYYQDTLVHFDVDVESYISRD